MSDLLQKCEVCQALLDEEDLFCANCGTEAPARGESKQQPHSQIATHNFSCEGCGASMSYDASARTLRCPFCGSEHLKQQQNARTLSPERVVPFAIDHDRAIARMREWLGKGFWRPGDLASAAAVAKITSVYVPYWVFQANTHTYWTADSSQTPAGARGDWFPLSGEHRGRYDGLLIGASGVLTPNETWAICPFDLGKSEPPESVDTTNFVVEQFSVQRKYARPQARQGLEAMEREACQRYVPGRRRNVKANVRLEGLAGHPVLLPVWIMAYQYKGRLFRFLLNGQSGKATGQAPVSYRKIIVAIAIVAAIVLLLFLGLAGFAAVAQAPPTKNPSVISAQPFLGHAPMEQTPWMKYGSRTNPGTSVG